MNVIKRYLQCYAHMPKETMWFSVTAQELSSTAHLVWFGFLCCAAGSTRSTDKPYQWQESIQPPNPGCSNIQTAVTTENMVVLCLGNRWGWFDVFPDVHCFAHVSFLALLGLA